ncbi:hypothetical protein D5S19_14845 [Amycolatopsis panacis]|uniref:Uncharacterized protein n=1 Tax=Amycolatopsis panacis TaxID=2340917 RepID=A0A419I433_9PSEU|nr:hypothetical protein D5S19_14845 [Amycolatopsis panacis]
MDEPLWFTAAAKCAKCSRSAPVSRAELDRRGSMVSQDWASLPAAVRRAIESRTGAVAATVSPDNGRNSDFLATLQTAHGRFVMGVLTGTRRARAQQTEARVGARPNSAAPRLLWEVTADGWHVLGFEALSGHHPSLAPGSPDLQMVAETVAAMARELKPVPRRT